MALDNLRDDLAYRLRILEGIKFPVHRRSHSTPRWNATLQEIIDEARESIATANRPETMFEAVAIMEKKVSTLINTVLRSFDVRDKLNKMEAKIETLAQINQEMININLGLIPYVEELVGINAAARHENPAEQELWESIHLIASHISTFLDENMMSSELQSNPEAINGIRRILSASKAIILISLLKEAHTEPGMELIRLLNRNLSDTCELGMMVFFTSLDQSMSIMPQNDHAFKETNDETDSLDIPIEQRDKRWINGSGAGSILTIPVMVSETEMEALNIPLTRENIVETSLRKLINGGFSYDSNGISFIPFQVQLIHELIHAVHNAEGANSRNVRLTKEEFELWETHEEYVTILGGMLNESQFITAYGAIPREHHGGMGADVLFNAETRRASQTILHAVNGDETPDAHQHFKVFKHSYKTIMADQHEDTPSRKPR